MAFFKKLRRKISSTVYLAKKSIENDYFFSAEEAAAGAEVEFARLDAEYEKNVQAYIKECQNETEEQKLFREAEFVKKWAVAYVEGNDDTIAYECGMRRELKYYLCDLVSDNDTFAINRLYVEDAAFICDWLRGKINLAGYELGYAELGTPPWKRSGAITVQALQPRRKDDDYDFGDIGPLPGMDDVRDFEFPDPETDFILPSEKPKKDGDKPQG